MNTISIATASVIGARHALGARNGQDASAAWVGVVSVEPAPSLVAPMHQHVAAVTRTAATGTDDAQAAQAAARPGTEDTRAGQAAARPGTEDTRAGQAAARPGTDDARAGQAAANISTARVGEPAAVIVVCDGCSSGGSSEVGARLGANLFAQAIGVRLAAGESPCHPAMWADARAEVVAQLDALTNKMVCADARADVVREHFLFTIVAAAVCGTDAALWALGDGVYSLGDYTRVLGPFADNAPPYVGYDLLGDPRPAHFEVVGARRDAATPIDTIIVGTDGASEIVGGVERFAARKYVDHPDTLRRELVLLAKPQERIDWDAHRVARTPAVLQDDCAIAVLRCETASAGLSLVNVEVST